MTQRLPRKLRNIRRVGRLRTQGLDIMIADLMAEDYIIKKRIRAEEQLMEEVRRRREECERSKEGAPDEESLGRLLKALDELN